MGGGVGKLQPPRIWEFWQIWARFKIFLGKVYDIFGLLYWIFWAIILFFFGQARSAPHAQVARYAYVKMLKWFPWLSCMKKHRMSYRAVPLRMVWAAVMLVWPGLFTRHAPKRWAFLFSFVQSDSCRELTEVKVIDRSSAQQDLSFCERFTLQWKPPALTFRLSMVILLMVLLLLLRSFL